MKARGERGWRICRLVFRRGVGVGWGIMGRRIIIDAADVVNCCR
jgi:hypothetical protein